MVRHFRVYRPNAGSHALTFPFPVDKGPFRRTSEITLRLLRQNEDTLMTILETFLHDPTTDLIGRKVK